MIESFSYFGNIDSMSLSSTEHVSPVDYSARTIEDDAATSAVVPDQLVQRVGVGHPAEQAGVHAKRDGGEGLDAETALERRAILGEQAIRQAEDLLNALVLPHVLVTLEQELICTSVS